jgi:hypothetical protein
MTTSKSSDADDHSKAIPHFMADKIVAIPFPVRPRHVQYGPLARVLDFLAWKDRLANEVDCHAKETLEQIEKLSIAEMKLWLIRRLLEIYDHGDHKDLYRLYEILHEKSPDGA